QKDLGTYCRGGPPWPPVAWTKAVQEATASVWRMPIKTTGGHGGPPLQYAQFVHKSDWQPHDVEIVALDFFDEERRFALYAVSAGFAERLARASVPIDLFVAHLCKTHTRRFITNARFTSDTYERNAGQNLMPFGVQQIEHSCRVCFVKRLAEDLIIDNNSRIRAKHQSVVQTTRDLLRLRARESLHISCRLLVW